MSLRKGSPGLMYYEMEYEYIFTGAYNPNYRGYSPYLLTKAYYQPGTGNNNKVLGEKIKRPLC